MPTAFAKGQLVRARTDTQDLTAGRLYEVVDVQEQYTAFGTFVWYVVNDRGFTDPRNAKLVTRTADHFIVVGNGHLVLEAADGGNDAR